MFFNKLNKEIEEFAQKHGFKGAKYIGKWKTYKVFEPYMSSNEISYTGLPLVILANENNEIRWSTSDEAMATMNDESFMKSYENNQENNNTKKMDINYINTILNSILTTVSFLNVENIKDIKFLPSKQGFTVEVSNGIKKLYMRISEYGYVEIVRENSIDGKIVYVPNDDYVSNDNTIKKLSEYILSQPICPFCGSMELLKYKYGEPISPIDESKYILGGCVIDGHNPKYKCKKCEKDIYLEDINNNQTDYLNLPTNELVNKTVDRIDKMIDTLNNQQGNETASNEVIDIDKNLKDVENYSIINKSIEELLVENR